jgi:hypothetical protein
MDSACHFLAVHYRGGVRCKVPSLLITDDRNLLDDAVEGFDAFDIVILISEKVETVSGGILVFSVTHFQNFFEGAICDFDSSSLQVNTGNKLS